MSYSCEAYTSGGLPQRYVVIAFIQLTQKGLELVSAVSSDVKVAILNSDLNTP